MQNVTVAGIGIHPFGRFSHGYRQLGAHAAREALTDAGVTMADLDMVLVGNVGAEMAKGQNIMDGVGRPGIPIINVEAACASSASTLFLGAQMIESGAARAILCLGVEKAPRGFIAGSGYEAWQIETGLGVNPAYFALAAQELISTTDATVEDLADISVKNHRHAVANPNAMYRKECTREEVLNSRAVCPPLTLLMLCAPNEGAAAVVLMARAEAERRGITGRRLAPFGRPGVAGTGRLVRSGPVLPGGRADEPHRTSRPIGRTRRPRWRRPTSTSSSARTPMPRPN